MAYIVARGNVWYARYKEGGKWKNSPTEFRVNRDADGKPDPSNKRNAQRVADRKQRQVDGGDGAAAGPMTVRRWAVAWLKKRSEANLDSNNDDSRLRHHVLDVIGDMPIADVRPKHIADLCHRWRHETKLAQRTVYNVYSSVCAMFRDAAIEGVVEQTPCILTNAQLGPLVDKDPEWRDGSQFTREEAETLVSDERIPLDRRVYYAFMLLAGMRPGEIAALRWRHFDSTVQPLGKLTVALAHNTRKNRTKGTKTGAVRHVPVHPTLAAMLAEWKLSGWAAMTGRAHESDDLVLPLPPEAAEARRSRKGEPFRTDDYAGKRWREEDLPMLGWRAREMYAMKSTFITLCGKDRASRDAIKRVTHAPTKRDAFDGYDRDSHWDEMCEAVEKLKLARRHIGAKLVSLK
jgi:integrase